MAETRVINYCGECPFFDALDEQCDLVMGTVGPARVQYDSIPPDGCPVRDGGLTLHLRPGASLRRAPSADSPPKSA